MEVLVDCGNLWEKFGASGRTLMQKKKYHDDAGGRKSWIFSKTLNLNLNLNRRTKTKPKRELETENHELLTQTKQHMDCWHKRAGEHR